MIDMFDKGFRLVAEIKKLEEGSTAYIVGGAVRDYILGRECDDIDIATSVDINIIEQHFPTHEIGSNKDFGVLVVEFEDEVFEIANYREDGEYSDGRRPDGVVIVNDFKTDSTRRDFTINAMAMDEDKNIIDYHNGQEDLKNRSIRTVGNAEDRFNEDYLRMFRAVRFACVLDFDMSPEIEQAILKLNFNISKISTERFWKEFWKMAQCNEFASGVYAMWNMGMLKYVLPEIDTMSNYPQLRQWHPEGNVWEHTFSVVRHLGDKSAVVKLGGLFHDIGKPVAYEWFPEKNQYHYYQHDHKGLDVFDKIVDRIHIPKDIANEIRYSIKNHMKMHKFNEMKDSKCYALMDSPYWDSLYQVSHGDDQSRLYCYDWHWWQEADAKIARLQTVLDNKKDVESVVNGNFIMEILEIKGGKKVGDVLKKTKAYIIDKKIDVKSDIGFARIKKYVSTCK